MFYIESTQESVAGSVFQSLESGEWVMMTVPADGIIRNREAVGTDRQSAITELNRRGARADEIGCRDLHFTLHESK